MSGLVDEIPQGRRRLPQRRATLTLSYDYVAPDGPAYAVTATLGFYDGPAPGRLGVLGEVFLNVAGRAGSTLDVLLREAAVGLSFALQFGASPRDVVAAFARDAGGRAEGALGQLFALLDREGLI